MDSWHQDGDAWYIEGAFPGEGGIFANQAACGLKRLFGASFFTWLGRERGRMNWKLGWLGRAAAQQVRSWAGPVTGIAASAPVPKPRRISRLATI